MKIAKRKNNCRIILQRQTTKSYIPSRYYFQRWVNLALAKHNKPVEVTIRIVNQKESALLNETYRHKTGPTNILSFPFETPPGIKMPLLGDLVICAPLVAKEAKQQQKTLIAHWAHLVIHGILHLLGYDHIKKKDAAQMEKIEIELLARLGFADPYHI